MKSLNRKLFDAINHPKYYNAITNEGKATHNETYLYKKLTISDIKKWKKGNTYKLTAYEFSSYKWSTFSFKYDGIKGKEIYGKSKYMFNNPLILTKNGDIRSVGGDISEIYIYNEKVGKPLITKTFLRERKKKLIKQGLLKRKKKY